MASCLTLGFFKLGVDPDIGYYRTVGVHPPPASSSVSPLLIYPHYESAFAFVVGSLFVRTDGGPSLIDASQMTFFSTLCKLCGKRPHGATLLEIIPDRLPAVLLKHLVEDESPGYWVRILNKVRVPKVLILDDLPQAVLLKQSTSLLLMPSAFS